MKRAASVGAGAADGSAVACWRDHTFQDDGILAGGLKKVLRYAALGGVLGGGFGIV